MNDMIELWCLLNFLMPEIFNDLGSFKTWFNANILYRHSLKQSIIKSELENNILTNLHEIIQPFILRRTKSIRFFVVLESFKDLVKKIKAIIYL